MEEILGPVNGFFVATYTAPGADLCHVSYAKICRRKPASYWGAQCLVKLFAGEDHASPAAALASARQVAHAQIDDLPSLDCSTFGLDLPYFDARSGTAA